jgi:2-oxoglutarate dehydrogenase E2 component (dihydrolipoamide succinyltransferase)
MRKSIANHMARSVQTAPHVTSVFEADLSAVLSDRATRKADQGAEAVPSVTAYLIQAALKAIRVVSEVNSKWHDDYLEVFDWVNFGVGTALESGGLVVPVIRGAQAMDLLTLSQRLRDLTQKARSGKLTQDDMSGGTFTLSNHGVSGSLLAAPIILPHGQAAILGVGKMQRRVIVCETGGRELFRIRPMMYVTLTIDHRVLDGQQTNLFLTKFVAALEASNDADAEA